MGVPDNLFPPNQRALIRVRPAETSNAYNQVVRDYGAAASREAFAGWLQQDKRAQPEGTEGGLDGRDLQTQQWLLITNYTDIREHDQLEWTEHPNGTLTLELDGPPEPVNTPAGLHHTETNWRKIAG